MELVEIEQIYTIIINVSSEINQINHNKDRIKLLEENIRTQYLNSEEKQSLFF